MQRASSLSPLRRLVSVVGLVGLIFSSFLVLFRPFSVQALDATPYLNPSLPDYGIQQAIDDAAAAGGGVVQLPAGTYTLETYLQLKNGVTLQGTGANTVLKAGRNEQRVFITQNYNANSTNTVKVASVAPFYVGQVVYVWRSTELKFQPSAYTITAINSTNSTLTFNSTVSTMMTANVSQVSYGLYTKLTANAAMNTTSITVADTSVFNVGEALVIKTAKGVGTGNWGVELNIVAAIDAATGTITLKNALSLSAPSGTVVFHGYPGILALGNFSTKVTVTTIGVKDLVIEGWNDAIKPAFYDFYLGGINFVMCDRATISNVTIRYWHSDAFSLQRCYSSTVTDTTALENRGHGFHPGTASKLIEFVRIHALNNLGFIGYGTQGDGLYYCWDNVDVNIRQSEFRGNAGSGVGDVGGAIGTTNTNGSGNVDNNLIIEDNVMENNGRAGISVTGGGTNTNTMIRRNVIKNNNVSNLDYAGINILADTSHAQKYTINNNWVESSSVPATQFCGIRERNGSYTANFNIIKDNIVLNHRDCSVSLVGANSVESGTQNTAPNTTPTPVPPTATVVAPTATPTGAYIVKLVLYNADTDQPIAGFDPLLDNAVIDYAAIGTTNLSIVAIKNPATGGSVRFGLDGNANYRTESSAPYAIQGDSGTAPNINYTPISPTLALGSHTVVAMPFSSTGNPGTSKTVTFTIVNNVATATATQTATETATQTATQTATMTATQTATETATQTATQTATMTATATETATMTATATATQTATMTATATQTATMTATIVPTATATNTPITPPFNGGKIYIPFLVR